MVVGAGVVSGLMLKSSKGLLTVFCPIDFSASIGSSLCEPSCDETTELDEQVERGEEFSLVMKRLSNMCLVSYSTYVRCEYCINSKESRPQERKMGLPKSKELELEMKIYSMFVCMYVCMSVCIIEAEASELCQCSSITFFQCAMTCMFAL